MTYRTCYGTGLSRRPFRNTPCGVFGVLLGPLSPIPLNAPVTGPAGEVPNDLSSMGEWASLWTPCRAWYRASKGFYVRLAFFAFLSVYLIRCLVVVSTHSTPKGQTTRGTSSDTSTRKDPPATRQRLKVPARLQGVLCSVAT